VWLAFLPRAQEVKIAYVNPEAVQFDKSFCYICHFIQQRQYYNWRNYFFLHHCKINFHLEPHHSTLFATESDLKGHKVITEIMKSYKQDNNKATCEDEDSDLLGS
jgi:hypothetical protein